ncbi:hypothetical protein AXF42_Ash004038 [Apostasia shenzhenica]|uniref:Uncharacterized protein n=1 Tax=Apostasia shenzhenica TaxID=1088818 RepID=A0A2I0A1T2_9ASPA|nr:hypothetical protein AXF42_Ash004038 [Apostasia shenzhenica]
MGRPEKEGRCKRHPTHKQAEGVCPYCLQERLAGLSGTSSSSSTTMTNASSSSVTSTEYSSYDSEANSSPEELEFSPGEVRSTKRLVMQLLRRSRSTAAAAGEGQEKKKKKKKKKKGRFWSKLLTAGARRKEREGVLSHSKTVKEKSSSKWGFFS